MVKFLVGATESHWVGLSETYFGIAIVPEGAHVKILTGMLVLFFGFEIWPNPIFLGWQIF